MMAYGRFISSDNFELFSDALKVVHHTRLIFTDSSADLEILVGIIVVAVDTTQVNIWR